MSFNEAITARLTGATLSQLRNWRSPGVDLLTPEIRPKRPPIYSFRDLILARSLAFLRARVSHQKITKAVGNLLSLPLTYDHMSEIRFGTDGSTIYIGIPGETHALDILSPKLAAGQFEVFTFEQLSESFTSFNGDQVVDFEHPRKHLSVTPNRLGGWPVIEGTRVPYDVVADLLLDGDVEPNEVEEWYPGVSAAAARDAADFARSVEKLRTGEELTAA